MPNIEVNLGVRSYNIEIGNGTLFETDFTRFGNRRCAIITDSNVRRLYGEELKKSLIRQGLEVELLEFPAGEQSKISETATQLGRELAKRDFDRKSLIIALGGGVVGDLAGYVASFYERGLDYIQVPTTLLAQVDASIGGKTGVDIPEGKNMFGYFHQPLLVLTDVATLRTLPQKEIRNGLAEIIKYGMTQDVELFKDLEENLSNLNEDAYLRLVEKSCRIKARIVEKDETETELRKILNYGHTIGHAIEAAEGYRISHGEAVALGMVYEARISSRLGLLDNESLTRQNGLIQAAGLPVRYGGNFNNLIEIMKRDKKVRNGRIHFILPVSVGAVKEQDEKIAFPVDEELIK